MTGLYIEFITFLPLPAAFWMGRIPAAASQSRRGVGVGRVLSGSTGDR